jgi:acetyl-CoA carboxylase biotin carboxyl carrier protein
MKPQDIEDLKPLIEFLKSNQVAEFDLDRGDLKIRLKFVQPEAPVAGLGDLVKLLGSASAAPSASVAQAPAAEPPSEPEEKLHVVTSPMVGTFYASPTPGSAPFVSPGDKVTKGQVVGIVEAMKLMNDIEADASGEVVKCLAVNGQPIEFGQPLLTLRTA